MTRKGTEEKEEEEKIGPILQQGMSKCGLHFARFHSDGPDLLFLSPPKGVFSSFSKILPGCTSGCKLFTTLCINRGIKCLQSKQTHLSPRIKKGFLPPSGVLLLLLFPALRSVRLWLAVVAVGQTLTPRRHSSWHRERNK